MDHFKKFNNRLWTAKGEKFVASLELKSFKPLVSRYQDIDGWYLTAREFDRTSQNLLGVFVPKRQWREDDFNFKLYMNQWEIEILLSESVDGKFWSYEDLIVSRAEEMLDALGYY